MITRIGFAPRRAGLSTPEFLAHWRTDHADAAGRLPGLRRYVQLHPVLVGGVHALGYPGFDACSVLVFDDVSAMDAAFASSEYRGAVAADEARFVDKDRFGMFVGDGALSDGPDAAGSCWLLTLLRRHPAVAADQLVAALREDVRVGAEHVGRDVLASVDLDRHGREALAYDAAEVVRFPDEAAGRAWTTSVAAQEAALPMAGLTAGVTRLLAAPVVVI